MSAAVTARAYDLVLYGAGGFTGRQTVAYVARHPDAARLRWAVAGRHRERLERALAHAGVPRGAVGVLVADSADAASVDAVARRARVLLSTAGPFARHGTPVVDACVRHGTHYADITGETVWVRGLVARHHARAAADGTRIVNFCGFDSVPSDLGAFLVARHLRDALGVACVEVRAYFRMRGGFNGGTIATMLDSLDSGDAARMGDPFLLDPPRPRTARQRRHSRDLALPHRDAAIGAWTGPFFMAPTNTRVVRRSAALHEGWGEPYGPAFVYREALRYGPPLAPLKAAAATAGMALAAAALRTRTGRRLVAPRLPKPGSGPSPEAMRGGWFTCDLLGIGTDGRRARGRIAYRGDPGNRATVTFLCESALALALDAARLPGGRERGGVLTPATALGHVLADRLRRAGVAIDVGAPG